MTHIERLVGLPERTSDNGGRPEPAPSQLHRALALLATISLFIGTRAAWTDALTLSPTVMVVISVGYLTILGLAALSLVVRTQRVMVVADLLILVAAAVQVVGALILQHKPTDEGTLIAQAARSLLGGGEIYGVAWPQLFAQQHLPVTWMMGGGADYTLGYPPLAVLLTAPALLVFSFPAAASIVTTLVLLVGAFALWRLLPIDWRPGATIVMLGFPFMPITPVWDFPRSSPWSWLIPVVVRWPYIGRAGRLRSRRSAPGGLRGRAHARRSSALVRGAVPPRRLDRVRRGEFRPAPGLRHGGSVRGVAGLTFLAIDLPFIVRDPPAWASGVALVLTQHAVPHGQGLIDMSFYLTDGSAELDFDQCGPALGGGLLGVTAMWIRRLGPALTVLPWLVFYLSVRSQDGYFLLMTPLWLAAAATAPPSVSQHAWQPRISPAARPIGRLASGGPRRLPGFATRALLAASLLAPSLLCASVAIASDEPLELAVVSTTWHGPHAQGLWQISVDVVNGSTVALAPHFTVSTGQGVTPFWNAVGGPAQLAPRQEAIYLLTAANKAGYAPGPNGYLLLRALTDGPMTVSTTPVPIP